VVVERVQQEILGSRFAQPGQLLADLLA
jgi:hypothetical protein